MCCPSYSILECIFPINKDLLLYWASSVAQMVKNLLAIQETWVWSLVHEDTLEKGMATHSGILAWRIPRTEEPGGLQSTGPHRVRHDWATINFHFTFFISYVVAIRTTDIRNKNGYSSTVSSSDTIQVLPVFPAAFCITKWPRSKPCFKIGYVFSTFPWLHNFDTFEDYKPDIF